MSDFLSPFWSYYVGVIVVVGIFACALLLWLTSKTKAPSQGVESTGHVWDEDIVEMNNPLPLWWVGLFVITIIFGLSYLYLYPGLGSNPGELAWSSKAAFEQEKTRSLESLAPLYAKYDAMTVEEIAKDPQAHAIGQRLFINNCSQCHGSDAQGSKGFPNLSDHDWLHGGEPANIVETITKGRIGMMPPMAAAVGSPEDVKNVAQYVLSLSGSLHDAALAAKGKEKFTLVCGACHGADGRGNTAIGSANLTDHIWLHGVGEQAIISMIENGKVNQMPAQEGRLTGSQIKMLAAYVWGLSNVPSSSAPSSNSSQVDTAIKTSMK
jgi:cytochrome c oxidase cbb3-type subunit 3